MHRLTTQGVADMKDMEHRQRFIIFMSVVLWVTVFAQSCLPVFQRYQDARTQKPGTHEITPNVSVVSFTEDGETEHVQNQLGIQMAVGLTPRADLRAAYTRIEVVDIGGSNFIGFGPKFSVVPARFAIFAPVDFAFGEDIEVSDTWSFSPIFLFSSPINEDFEINPSTTVRIPLYEDGETLLAFNLGMGLGSATGPWKLRPEFGVLVNPGESGFAWSFGLGLSFGENK